MGGSEIEVASILSLAADERSKRWAGTVVFVALLAFAAFLIQTYG